MANNLSIRVLKLRALVYQAWYLAYVKQVRVEDMKPPLVSLPLSVASASNPKQRTPLSPRIARHFKLCQALDLAEAEERMFAAINGRERKAA